MDFAQTVILGALAGFTIFLGLPVARLKQISPRIHTFLGMISAGIIFFLLFDIIGALSEPIETSLQAAVAGQASLGNFLR